jgi:membrane protein YqaA with SNARE-associated domain
MGFLSVDAYKKNNDVVSKHGAKWLRSKHAEVILALVSFAESVFAPILIDPFLIALVLASPHRWKRYVLISISASVVGGAVAYMLGALFFDTLGAKIIAMYSLENTFATISENLNNNGFAFVLIGAFTPIPYKIVALASGLLHINFLTFIVASIFGRILRLGLVGMAASMVGPHALPVVRKHLYTIAAVIGLLLGAYIIIRLFL